MMRIFKWLLTLTYIMCSWALGPAAHASDGPTARTEIEHMLIREAQKSERVRPELALAVAKVESNYNQHALSHKGAIGVMQIMPATGRGVFGVEPERLWDPETNVRLGVTFLDSLLKRYRGREDLALSHYNGGSRVGAWPHSRVIPYTRGYVDKVLEHANSPAILAKVQVENSKPTIATRLWDETHDAFSELETQLALLRMRTKMRGH